MRGCYRGRNTGGDGVLCRVPYVCTVVFNNGWMSLLVELTEFAVVVVVVVLAEGCCRARDFRVSLPPPRGEFSRVTFPGLFFPGSFFSGSIFPDRSTVSILLVNITIYSGT